MTTYVKIVNLNEENFSKFSKLFKTESEDNSYVELFNHFNILFDKNFREPDNVFNRDWMEENIGSKWMTIEYGDTEYSPEVNLIIESAYSVPTGYLQSLFNHLQTDNQDVVLYGTYEEESYDPIGAFVYGDDYDDIEDYDEIDSERMWDDDDYREEIMDLLHDHRDSLYENYLEVKKEREEEN